MGVVAFDVVVGFELFYNLVVVVIVILLSLLSNCCHGCLLLSWIVVMCYIALLWVLPWVLLRSMLLLVFSNVKILKP